MNYENLANKETIEKTIKSLSKNRITAEVVNTKEKALEKIKQMIPKGASVMNGSSTTLEQIGFINYLKTGGHGWDNYKNKILSENDLHRQKLLQKQAVLSDYYLGSVHAVTEQGQLVFASNSGSQLPHIVFTSPNLIFVVSTQKIVPTLEDAFKRVREHVLPLEIERMKSVRMGGSQISKWVIIEKEPDFMDRKVNLIFVNEKLGF